MSAELLLQQLNTRSSKPIELDRPMELAQLATPALVLDRGLLSNMRKMAAHVQHHDKKL